MGTDRVQLGVSIKERVVASNAVKDDLKVGESRGRKLLYH